MVDPVTVVKAAALLLSDENTRKKIGWVIVAVLSPVILVVVFILSLASGAAGQNVSVVELCFSGGAIPEDTPSEYRACIQEMRDSFDLLDGCLDEINGQTEDGASLDGIRVKAVFYALYFGAASPAEQDHRTFADCFVTREERTRTITGQDDGGNEIAIEETYTVAVPIEDLDVVYRNIAAAMGVEATEDQRSNAESIDNLIRYGNTDGTGGSDPGGTDAVYVGANGFCSPVGENWRSIVTSEFGLRRDPFTGETSGHGGIDLAVPAGTSVRAALGGTVTTAAYNSSYGYYVKIDHGGGLSTLYAHNSRLLVQAGQTVRAGDVVSLSGSTGRSTGPHLHFEVRVNGERVNPRNYLP